VQEEIPVPPPPQAYTIPAAEKHSGLQQLKESVITQISAGFEALEAEYAALYASKETLEQDRRQLESTREVQESWIVEQRDDLVRLVSQV